MDAALHHFLKWFYFWSSHTPLSMALAKSRWAFPIVETFHIVGMTLLLGSVLVLNLSILGVGLRKPAELAKDVEPFLLVGLITMLCTGIPMFMTTAAYYAPNPAFKIKMSLLACAILLQLAIHKTPGMYKGSTVGKVTAFVAVLCWFAIAYAGRAIAFTNLFGV